MKVRCLLAMAAIAPFMTRPAGAGPWSIEPRVGFSAEYASNPLLHQTDVMSEEHFAGLLDLPLRYDAEGLQFLLHTSGRLSNSSGYSSLASDYFHVDSALQFSNDLGVATLQASLARDSSLYNVGGLVNGVGVRKDTAGAGGDWTHSMTERSSIALDASWTRVRYSESNSVRNLTDYRYTSGGPTYTYLLSELESLKVITNYGQYQSLNGINDTPTESVTTSSSSETLNLSYVRQMSEIWSVTTTVGYTRSKNTEKFFFGPFFLGNLESNQNSAVYAVNATRQGEKFNLSGGVGRALQPTGLAYLSRQDSINFNASYTRSQRWDYSLGVTWVRTVNPIPAARGSVQSELDYTGHYLNTALTANWHWTEQLTVAMHATRITQQNGLSGGGALISSASVSGASTGISIEINRQFLRTEL